MKLLHEQVVGGIMITGLVTIGLIIAEKPELPGWLNSPFFSAGTPRALSSITISSVDWSADGQKLLCRSRGSFNAQHSLSIHNVNDATAFTPAWGDVFAGGILQASLAPDGLSVVLATHTGELWWIDLETSAATELVPKSPQISFVATAISHDGRLMAGSSDDGNVYLCDPTHGDMTLLVAQQVTPALHLRFSSDGRRLLCERTNGWLSLWDTLTAELLCELSGYENSPTAAAFLPCGNRIIMLTGNDTVQFRDVISGDTQWHAAHGHFGNASVDVTFDGKIAAWGGTLSNRIVIWDVENQCKKFEIPSPALVLHLSFSPDGTKLAVAGRENVVRIYDVQNGKELRSIDVTSVFDSRTRS